MSRTEKKTKRPVRAGVRRATRKDSPTASTARQSRVKTVPPDVRHYSGQGSYWFWDRVNAFRGSGNGLHSALYLFGCALQDIEGRAMQALEAAEKDAHE